MTAVEWLMLEKALVGYIDDEMVQQAIEMEKHQIIDAYIGGYSAPENRGDSETYYNETFKNI
jgi:hypothetical protein